MTSHVATAEMARASGQGLLDFLVWSSAVGFMASNTARSYRSASEAVMRAMSDDLRALGVTGFNLENIGPLFRERVASDEKLRNTYSESTIDTYIKRFTNAATEYLRYLDNPPGYTPSRRPRQPERLVALGEARSGKSRLVGSLAADRIRHQFPLERGGDAFIEVPRDLTHNDVTRLTSFLRGLVVSEPALIDFETELREIIRHRMQEPAPEELMEKVREAFAAAAEVEVSDVDGVVRKLDDRA